MSQSELLSLPRFSDEPPVSAWRGFDFKSHSSQGGVLLFGEVHNEPPTSILTAVRFPDASIRFGVGNEPLPRQSVFLIAANQFAFALDAEVDAPFHVPPIFLNQHLQVLRSRISEYLQAFAEHGR